VLDDASYVLGAGADGGVALGALLEVLLIIANVGTAVALFPVLKRHNEGLALGYVTARLVECTFIAIGGIFAVSARSAAALTLTGLIVVGLGAVLRSAAGTITTAVAVLFAPPILGALVSNEIVATLLDHLPAGLSTVLVSGTGERYSPEVAALLLGAWAVGSLAVGVIILYRRDP
jgi:hypothetical protein